jgi:hypothetical protein
MIMEYIGDRILSKHDYDSYKNFGYKDIMENIGLGYILRGCSIPITGIESIKHEDLINSQGGI